MTILPIVIFPDQRLLSVSQEISNIEAEDIPSLSHNMIETMHKNQGMGLAAIQVGVSKRIFVVDIPESCREDCEEVEGFCSIAKALVIINPVITYTSKETIKLEEGCLSIPSKQELIVRPKLIELQYLNLKGQNKILKASGWLARCCQHEIDHLNGKLFIHHLSNLRYNMAINQLKKKRT